MTRVLSLVGADLPENLAPPIANNNSRGFWESADVVRTHDELLHAAGTRWDDWRRVAPEWFDTPACGRFRARLLAVVAANFSASRLFVIKDPRMCRLFPLWRGVLEAFDADLRVVIPLRNPVEVASSLGDRDGFSPARSHLLWLRHVLDAERETRDLRRCVVPFGKLLDDPRHVLRTIGRRLAIKWPRSIASAREEIDEFLSLSERHHAVDDRSLELRGDVPAWVRHAYEALAAMAREGESAKVRADLDAISAEIDRATPTFGGLLAEHSAELRDRAAEIESLRTTLSARAAEVAALQEELAAVRTAVTEGGLRTDQLSGELAGDHAALAERGADLETLRGELAGARAALAERGADLETLRGELTDVRAALAQQAAEAGSLDGQLSALRGVLDTRSAEAARLHESAAYLRAALDAAGQERAQEVEALRWSVIDRDAEVARLARELDDLHGQLRYMLDSVSWKLTAPLRSVRGRFRRARRVRAPA